MIKAEDNITLKSNKPLYDNAQYFWQTGTGTDTGAHITEKTKTEFEADPANGGGNLIARSDGIAVRDGLTELATFGADGLQIGKDDEKHIEVLSNAFNVYDEDGSVPFSVSTESSLKTAQRGASTAINGSSDTYHLWSTNVFVRGTITDNKIYFGVSSSGQPSTFSSYVTLPSNPTSFPTSASSVTVDGITCTAFWKEKSTVFVSFENTSTSRKNVGYRYTESYYETTVKVNDAALNNKIVFNAPNDVTGVSVPGVCQACVYGHVVSLLIRVYNTSSIAAGSMIYQGNLMAYLPEVETSLTGLSSTNKLIHGTLTPNGLIQVFNTTTAAITSSASSPITLHATYVCK